MLRRYAVTMVAHQVTIIEANSMADAVRKAEKDAYGWTAESVGTDEGEFARVMKCGACGKAVMFEPQASVPTCLCEACSRGRR